MGLFCRQNSRLQYNQRRKHMQISAVLQQLIIESIHQLEREKDFSFEVLKEQIHLEHPADPSFGDYSTNCVMVLFSSMKKTVSSFPFASPREFAQALTDIILNKLENNTTYSNLISSVTLAGSGFINFTLSDTFLLSKMGLVVQKQGKTIEQIGKGKKVVAEYSSPNIAKPFTVGHLRSTIIGDAVANALEETGHTVYRDNHLGDWGTQFGKQIYAIKTWGNEDQIDTAENPVKELVALYVKFHDEAEKDPEIIDRGREWFVKLESGDAEARRLWEKCINWSWSEFEKIYATLGVTFTENNGRGYGESFFEDKMGEPVAQLKEAGILVESEGAQLVFFDDEKYPPLMIIKKDGSTLYSTRDLATDLFRLKKYGKDILVFNETGSEQSLYFKQLYDIEQRLGWYSKEQRIHIGHGLIRFKDKKMSTRKGNVVWLEDVLQESFDRVSHISAELDTQSIWKIAIGALKWNDLKQKMHLPIIFDWDEMISLKGNSGPYMQYTYVRCQSVLKKAVLSDENNDAKNDINVYFDTLLNNKEYLNHKPNMEEKRILRNLYIYSDVVKQMAEDFSPHTLANYLYELAVSFNSFYNNHKIIESESEMSDEKTTQFRLLLVQATAQVLKLGLRILGIQTVEKM